MQPEITVLTGPPGAGKTAIADVVASNAARPTVHLVTDTFYRSIRTGFVAPFLPEAQRQNEVVVEAIAAACIAFARGGYDVIVDGVVGPWFLPPFRAATAARGIPLSYVVLRPDLATTLTRAQTRPGSELRDPTVIAGLYHAFADLGDLERHAIDTAGDDVERSAERVAAAVASGAFRL